MTNGEQFPEPCEGAPAGAAPLAPTAEARQFSEEAIELLLKDMRLDMALAAKSDREIAHLLRMLWDHATIASATGAVLHQAIDRLWRASGGPMTDEDEVRVMDAQEMESGP